MSRGSASSWAALTLVVVICTPQAHGALSLSADLVAFSKALNFTPQGWTASSTVPACNWTGITCQPLAANGTQLFSIDLSGRSLGSASLPASWATLPSLAQGLTSLNLTGNVLQGSLPDWSGFSVLQALVLDDNLISGSLPSNWSTWTAPLTNISLSSNNISGSLPVAWGNAGFASLQQLNLSTNLLTGSIPGNWTGFQGLASLTTLNLAGEGNELRGSLPANWTARPPRFITQGGQLLLTQPGNDALCTLGGKLPSTFKGAVNSTGAPVTLQDCGDTTGWGPQLLAWTRSFSNFAEVVSQNQLWGWSEDTVDVPCSWSQVACVLWSGVSVGYGGPFVPEPLLTVTLNNYGLVGSIDSSWTAIGASLFHFELQGASIQGQLPASWAQSWPKISYWAMSNTKLQSTLPPEWGQGGSFPYLANLFFDNNPGLNGSIPSTYGSSTALAALKQLSAANTSLSGPLPSSLKNLGNLQTLNLASTSVCGSVTTQGNSSNNVNATTLSAPVACPPTSTPSPAPAAPVPAAGTPPSSPNAVTPAPPKGSSSNAGAIAGGIVGGLAALALVLAAFFLYRRRSSRRKHTRLLPEPGSTLRSDDPTLAALMTGGSTSYNSGAASSSRGLTGSSKGTGSSRTLGSPREKSWEIDPTRIQVARHPDGQLLKLGSGAFGTVYKASLDGTLPVAVKMMKPDTMDASIMRAFINEVQILHDSRHPHVVLFLGAFLGESELFMVQELMAGDLWNALADPSQQEVLRWRNRGKVVALDIALGLAYLHQSNILHLDIKSANILLTPEGRAKIADAGLAVAMMNETHRSQMSMRGTFSWMAPEVMMGAVVTSKADVYSLGLVLWEICTHERPARGQNRDIECPEDCPQEVADLIYKCMAPNAEDRPSAKELVHALENLSSRAPRS